MIDCALFGDDISKPVELINYAKYGSVNSHLELRRTDLGFEYSHVMPDANGRRYHTFYNDSIPSFFESQSPPKGMSGVENNPHLPDRRLHR